MHIEDQSQWMSVDGYDKPDTVKVKITHLETGQSKSLDLYTKQRNRITWGSASGDSPHICIKDGFYCFECINCGTKYKIIRPYLCNVQCKVDELLAKAKTKLDKQYVNEFQLMIDTIKINSRLGMFEKASEIFQLLTKRLAHITCHSCNCG